MSVTLLRFMAQLTRRSTLAFLNVLVVFTCRRSWWLAFSSVQLRWGFYFFGWGSWLIGLSFVFGAWGRGLGASVHADVRVCLAGNRRFLP